MKHLFTTLLCSLTLFTLRADVIFNETFSYVNGPIIAVGTNLNGTTNWFRHSGSASPSDSLINNGRLEISATGGTVSRADDVNRRFTSFTNTQTIVYSSFTVNCTNLPPATGTYFAHFWVNSTTFHGRVFAQAGLVTNTWRLGISGAAGTPSQVFPLDLATNTDYQVVVQWDPTGFNAATLWVNPLSSADPNVISGDAVATPAAVQGYGFRQAGSFGSAFFYVTNLVVATTFDEAATNVWSTNAVSPVVRYQPQGGTNFTGTTINLSAIVAGQGLASLTYQWRKNGGDISNPNGNTNVFTISGAGSGDIGNYSVVATTPFGLSVTSAVASLWVTNPPVPATITSQPASTNVYAGQTAVLKVVATGPPTLSYQWYFNNSPLSDGPFYLGSSSDTLTIYDVRTINGNTGTYRVDVINPFGTTPSSNAVVGVTNPTAVSIAFLRTLVDPVFFLPTNTTTLWSVTGIVTTHTNITSVGNSSFYIQDATAGINVFYGGNSTTLPQPGDSVTVIGPLGQFNSLLELNLISSDPAHSVVTNSQGNALPAGIVLPFSFTNSPSFGGAGEAIRLFQGSVVTLTNVFFPDGFAGTNVFASGQNYVVTNAQGETFAIRVDSRVFDIIGQPIPQFAWTITGPMGFFLSTTATNRSAGFQLVPTRYVDIVTTAPPAVTATVALSGANPVISWTAQPYMSYSVLRATNVQGPYVAIASGLTFNNTAGQFTDTSASPTTRFYRVVSP
jgi:hypothetical protein